MKDLMNIPFSVEVIVKEDGSQVVLLRNVRGQVLSVDSSVSLMSASLDSVVDEILETAKKSDMV